MNHKQAVEFRKDILGLRSYYKMHPDIIKRFGTPEDILKALILLKEKGNNIRYWVGGDCEKIISNRGKFDIVLEIPSFSGYEESYRKVLTLDRFDENKLRIVNIYPNDCNCKYSIYFKGVGKLEGTCKHIIAAILYLQNNWEEFNNYLGLDFELDKLYRPYMEESYYWVSELENYIDLFNKLEEEKSLRSVWKKDILYNNIWNNKFPEKKKPLFFSLDERIRENYMKKYKSFNMNYENDTLYL